MCAPSYAPDPVPSGPSGSSGGGSEGSTGSSGASSGTGGLVNDPSVCTTYDDGSVGLSRCGVRGGGLDCGTGMFACTGICDQGPVCFARADCCSQTCSAFGSTKVCGTVGRLNDGDGTLVACDKGFASRSSTVCNTSSGVTCCTSGAPGYFCGGGAACAALEGGGYCCSSGHACAGYDSFCSDTQKCCSGLTCTDDRCRTSDFQCIPAGKPCTQGSVDCCAGNRCLSLGGGFLCMEPTPSQQQ